MTDLFENERIDDLEINDLRLIQNAEGYCFTSDSVLLANIVKARKTDKILDVGAGSGIISILLAGKMGYGNVSALEIQKNMAALAARNVEMNGLSDKIVVINSSLQDFAKSVPAESFDVIVSNPPYKKPDSGEMDKERNPRRFKVRTETYIGRTYRKRKTTFEVSREVLYGASRRPHGGMYL